MSLENQNTIFPGFGGDTTMKAAVTVIYDPLVTGFRAATAADLGSIIQSGNVTVAFPPIQAVSGNATITNFPINQAVTGTVNIGNLTANQSVSGNVNVTNFPATQTITGTVNVNNSNLVFSPTISTITGAGSVSGQHFVEFIFSSNFSGTIQNSLFLGSNAASFTFPLLQNNANYGVISYNIPTGNAQLVSF